MNVGCREGRRKKSQHRLFCNHHHHHHHRPAADLGFSPEHTVTPQRNVSENNQNLLPVRLGSRNNTTQVAAREETGTPRLFIAPQDKRGREEACPTRTWTKSSIACRTSCTPRMQCEVFTSANQILSPDKLWTQEASEPARLLYCFEALRKTLGLSLQCLKLKAEGPRGVDSSFTSILKQ